MVDPKEEGERERVHLLSGRALRPSGGQKFVLQAAGAGEVELGRDERGRGGKC